MSKTIEMRNIAIRIEGLIDAINDDIGREKYLIGVRKGYLEGVNAIIKPWYSLLIEESKEKIEKLEHYKKNLNEIKDNLEKLEVEL